MNRVDSLGNVAGRFSDGNPQLGQIATRLNAKWHNAIQEEIVQVIERSGLVPSHDVLNQLYDAIVLTVAGAVGTGGASVPTTRQILTAGGMLTGGGNLAADRTIGLQPATSAEILAKVRNDVPITPFGLGQAVGGSLNTNGFYVFPGGLIIQWGVVRGTYGEGSVNTLLPTAFPSVFASLMLTQHNPTGSINNDMFVQGAARGLTQFTAFEQAPGPGNTGYGFDFIAIGY